MKNLIDQISRLKSSLAEILFRGSYRRRRVFEVAGYLLVTYHLARLGFHWYRNRQIDRDMCKTLQISASQVSANNRWLVLVVPDSTFAADDWLIRFLVRQRYSVFFGRWQCRADCESFCRWSRARSSRSG